MKLTWTQRLELLLYGREEIVISGITFQRRIHARLHAHENYSLQLPTMAEHKRQVTRQLHQDSEWRADVSRILARRSKWAARLGIQLL